MNDYQWSRKCQVILDEAQQYHQLTRAEKLNHLQKGNHNRLFKCYIYLSVFSKEGGWHISLEKSFMKLLELCNAVPFLRSTDLGACKYFWHML